MTGHAGVVVALVEQAAADRVPVAGMDGVGWVRLALRADVPIRVALDREVRDAVTAQHQEAQR